MAAGGQAVEITAELDEAHPEASKITFPVDENTYSLSPLFYKTAQDNAETTTEEGGAQ